MTWDCPYPKYRMENGSYYYYRDEIALPSMYDEVGVMIDLEEGILLKHGNPLYVKKYFDEAVKRYTEAGLTDFSRNFVYIEGKIPVDELNKSIHISGYARNIVRKYLDDPVHPPDQFPEP